MLAPPRVQSTKSRQTTVRQQRSDQQWLDDLRGQQGVAQQQQAYLDLANFLYRVGYNYLLQRQSNVLLLASQSEEELAAFAQDCVQDVLAKLYENSSARLDQFRGEGRFLGWAALIMRNHIAGLLRRSRYAKEIPPPETLVNHASDEPALHLYVTVQEVGDALQSCLDALPPARREAFAGCIVEGLPSKEVAVQLDRGVNAVDQLVFHAKRQLKTCLQEKGIGPDVLTLFE